MVVLDMDDTLTAFKNLEEGFVLRPHAVNTILDIASDPRLLVVLWSAGTQAYVENMLDVVLLPALQAQNPSFKFSTVLTYDDTNSGIKDLNKICDLFKVPKDSVILVDDALPQCSANMANGFQVIVAPPFDPNDQQEDVFMLNLPADVRERMLT